MTFIQRLLARLLSPAARAEMEAESRLWFAICPDCGHARSIWEMGGVRWKAAGRPRRLLRCPACGRRGWHVIEKRTD